MYSRIIKFPKNKSIFLFGPRGTGKTTWLKHIFTDAVYLDLLESEIYTKLLANPQRLEQFLPPSADKPVIIDEVQRVPALLHEVHRLIELKKINFILTGSSARKLKLHDVNLLAGRALTYYLHPLTAMELGNDFNLDYALQWGQLPAIRKEPYIRQYLASYVTTYLREEVQQEGLTRNIGAFSRFLEAASFSQAQVLNISQVARESSVHRKVVEEYFTILEDLLIAERIPVFTKRAKRQMIAHPKFFLFDVGVYRAIRPTGPLDTPEEIDGAALETLVYQEIKAINDYLGCDYAIYYWRTVDQFEVDIVLYGKKGIIAIEVKRSGTVQPQYLRGLKAFKKDYPMAKLYFLYGGKRPMIIQGIQIIPIHDFLSNIKLYL